MSWVDLLTDVQKEELRVLKVLRDRAVTQLGLAHLEVVRTQETLALAELNRRTAEAATFELNERIATRVRLFLLDKNVKSVDIDELV